MKKYIDTLMVISAFLLLVGCGTATGEDLANLNENNDQDVEQTNETEENIDENNEENDGQGNASNDSVDLITETGTYIGQADPHTIEIETADGPIAFQLTVEARDDIDGLTSGQQVTYQYEDTGEQLVIHTIDPAGDDLVTETGTYIGQADPHTIEIETPDGTLAFQLTIEARDDVAQLSPNEQVTYEYTVDGETRTIHSIKRTE